MYMTQLHTMLILINLCCKNRKLHFSGGNINGRRKEAMKRILCPVVHGTSKLVCPRAREGIPSTLGVVLVAYSISCPTM